VSEQTLQAPPRVRRPVTAARAAWSRRGEAGELARRWRWLLGAVGLLLISAVVVLAARVRPGYDPYGWLVWGHLTVHLALDTNGAPSWKPLPFLATVPFALTGHYALWLWMIGSVAVSLSGFVFAWRIAFRLTDAPPERRYASYAAGLVAAVALGLIANYSHFILSAQSDTMIVSLCLAAIDCQLCGRLRWAFWLWVLAALGRPEAWPFLGLYVIWVWRRKPERHHELVAGLALVPLLWFGIPALTAKSFFIAGDNALHSPRQLHGDKLVGTVQRFLDLNGTSILIAAGLASVIAAIQRRRSVLVLAAGVALWVLVEVAFAIHGWPAVPRYLFEAAGVVAVLAGVFVGRVILDLPLLIARLRAGLSPQIAGWSAVVVMVLFAGAMLPQAREQYRLERHDLVHERARATAFNRLSAVVARIGTARILACGQPNIPIGYQSVLGWYLGIKVGRLYVNQNVIRGHPHPLVNMYPTDTGWKVFPSHLATAAQRARCAGLTLRT
jgi:hypothetical protein